MSYYNAIYYSVWDSGETTVSSDVLVEEQVGNNGEPYLFIAEWGPRTVMSEDSSINSDTVDDAVEILDEEYVEYNGQCFTAHNSDTSTYDEYGIPDSYGNGIVFYDQTASNIKQITEQRTKTNNNKNKKYFVQNTTEQAVLFSKKMEKLLAFCFALYYNVVCSQKVREERRSTSMVTGIDTDYYRNNDTDEIVEAISVDFVVKPSWYTEMFKENKIIYCINGDIQVETTNNGTKTFDATKSLVIRHDNGEVDLVLTKEFKKNWTFDHTTDSMFATVS